MSKKAAKPRLSVIQQPKAPPGTRFTYQTTLKTWWEASNETVQKLFVDFVDLLWKKSMCRPRFWQHALSVPEKTFNEWVNATIPQMLLPSGGAAVVPSEKNRRNDPIKTDALPEVDELVARPYKSPEYSVLSDALLQKMEPHKRQFVPKFSVRYEPARNAFVVVVKYPVHDSTDMLFRRIAPQEYGAVVGLTDWRGSFDPLPAEVAAKLKGKDAAAVRAWVLKIRAAAAEEKDPEKQSEYDKILMAIGLADRIEDESVDLRVLFDEASILKMREFRFYELANAEVDADAKSKYEALAIAAGADADAALGAQGGCYTSSATSGKRKRVGDEEEEKHPEGKALEVDPLHETTSRFVIRQEHEPDLEDNLLIYLVPNVAWREASFERVLTENTKLTFVPGDAVSTLVWKKAVSHDLTEFFRLALPFRVLEHVTPVLERAARHLRTNTALKASWLVRTRAKQRFQLEEEEAVAYRYAVTQPVERLKLMDEEARVRASEWNRSRRVACCCSRMNGCACDGKKAGAAAS